jgi:two-component system response regulator FixJ
MESERSTVIVLDDDEAVRDSLRALLESAGFEVEIFGAGQDFLDNFDPAKSGCLISDVRMPGLSGLDIQQQLAERRSSLPVIMITGHGDIPMAVKAMSAGAVDFIEKPFADDALLDSVKRALSQPKKNLVDPESAGDLERRLERLTPREREVLDQLVIGNPNKVIAHELGISPRTVEIHRARVIEKMNARNLSHLVRLAITAGVLPNDSQL